jgi:serine/threonine protein kinase
MAVPVDCPGIESWQALFDGTIPSDQRELYERHLESCPACQERLDRDEEQRDSLRRLGRLVGDPTVASADPTLVQVLDRLHQEVSSDRSAPPEAADLYFLSPSDRPDVLGMLGAYEVQEVIGQGGMGVVLKAFEPALHRLVAIKVLAAAIAGSATARKRFTREAQAAAAVCHDHVVAVHGVHEADGLPYLVMQYVAGESLQDRLDRTGPLEVSEIVRIGMQTASGLAAAHAQGLIHRDIKPANLLLENGLARVKITDFGLARMVDDVGLTQNGTVAGTPEYMSPEQARGETVDHRADLFSLGSVLYAMCTGVPPFRAASAVAVLRQVSDQVPMPFREQNPDVPAWLETVVTRLMAKSPDERFQSAAEVASLLEGYLAHLRQPTTLPAPELPASRPPLLTRRRLLVAGGALSVLAVLGLAGMGLRRFQEPRPNESKAVGPKHGLTYLLVNKNSGRCLSVAGGASNPGAKIVQGPTPDQAGTGEHWILLSAGTAFRLLNEKSRLVLEIGNANPNPGVGAIQWHDQVTLSHQHWTLEPVEGHYLLRAGHAPFVLAIGEGLLTEGATALQWHHLPDIDDQLWDLRPADGSTPAASPPPAAPVPEKHKGWLAAGAIIGVGIVSMLALALWLAVRQRRRTGMVSAPVLDQQPKAEPISQPISFPCAGCGKSLKARAELAGKKVKCPHCGTASLVPETETKIASSPPGQRRWLWLTLSVGVLAVVAVTAYSLSTSPHRANTPGVSYLDQTLGLQTLPEVEEEGFLDPEPSKRAWPGETFRWTTGAARLVVPLGERAPQALFIRLGLTNPRSVQLGIRINGQSLFEERFFLKRDWSRTFDLSGMSLGKAAAIEIISDTVIPAQQGWGPTDQRTLGVCFLGASLLSGSQDFTQTPLGVRTVPGIPEEGFHEPELAGGQPCRWTDGAARLTVPLRGKTPRALALTLEIPDEKGYLLQVSVNGRKLFDDEVQPRDHWTAELPLDGVVLGEKAQIEVISSTVIPAQKVPGSKDPRKLGVRVRRLILVNAPPQQAQ